MTSTIGEVIDYLHSIAPNHLQENYDNAGLIVGDRNTVVRGVLISLDCTEDIVVEAISLGCNLIVSHHPIVFKGLKRFNGASYVERTVINALRNDIAIFAIHTNLDNVKSNGVNEMICNKIGLKNLKILKPKTNEESTIGAGMIGTLPEALSASDFLHFIKSKLNLSVIRHSRKLEQEIQRVAVCGGSGSFLLPEAKIQGADAFITADFKYHEFFDAEDQLMILDIGHYESERYTIDLLFGLISNNFSNFASHYTRVDTNPIKYYI